MNWRDYEIKKLTLSDSNFPAGLKKIKSAPKQIYFRGNLDGVALSKSIAVVGSRQITSYGREVIDKFVSSFVLNKVTTISGFMYGVDTQVHKKTVEYGGQTIAIFGCGLNICYPTENNDLYSEIVKTGGAVISEYPPDSKPQLWKYPQRNRLVAGLASFGVLVVEAGDKSGSLITAEFAKRQSKKVFAVPGPITSRVSFGTNMLIKKKLAILVTDPSDIYGIKVTNQVQKAHKDLVGTENKIYRALEDEPMSVDEIALTVGESPAEVAARVSIMSLKGYVTESLGKFHLVKN